MIGLIAIFSAALLRPFPGAEAYAPPEQVFGVYTVDEPTRGPEWPEPLRRRVLAALGSVHRDDLLSGVVPTRVVAGELWFDLRGIVVHEGEIPRTATLTRICWDAAHFESVDLTGANFSPSLLRGAVFSGCALRNVNYDGDHIEFADFLGSDLRGSSFRQVIFSAETRFANSFLDGAVFDHAAGPVTFIGGRANGVSFLDADMAGARFNDIDVGRSNFVGATLDKTEWFGSNIDKSDFREASLAMAKLTIAGGVPQFGRTLFYHTHLANLNVQGLDVSAIFWDGDDYRIGEEIDADNMPNSVVPHNNKENLYLLAEVFYRSLSRKYRDLGYLDEYLALRYRALETRRKILLLRNPAWSAELLWLNISRFWDDYGTNLRGILERYLAVVLLFAAIYFVGWLLKRRWFEWKPVESAMVSRSAGSRVLPMIGNRILPDEKWRRASGLWQHVGIIPGLLIESISLSLETSLLFAEVFLDYRRFLSLIRMRTEKLVPISIGTVLAGAEATLGFLLALSIVKRLALLIAT